MSHHATGTFDVKIAPLEVYNTDDKSLGALPNNPLLPKNSCFCPKTRAKGD